MSDTTIPVARILEFGLNAAIPADASVAWGARAIYDELGLKAGRWDIPHDRKSTFGEAMPMLMDLRERLALDKAARTLYNLGVGNRDSNHYTLYDDGQYRIVGRSYGGYVYLAAFPTK